MGEGSILAKLLHRFNSAHTTHTYTTTRTQDANTESCTHTHTHTRQTHKHTHCTHTHKHITHARTHTHITHTHTHTPIHKTHTHTHTHTNTNTHTGGRMFSDGRNTDGQMGAPPSAEHWSTRPTHPAEGVPFDHASNATGQNPVDGQTSSGPPSNPADQNPRGQILIGGQNSTEAPKVGGPVGGQVGGQSGSRMGGQAPSPPHLADALFTLADI